MADITPETFSGGFTLPQTITNPGRGRGLNFTKEDLVAALVAAQNQPQSPYQLPEGAPEVAGQPQDREADFQNQWDQAMQQYQARVANPRILAPGLTFAGQGGNLDTPEAAFQATVAPLRFQAAEFSPGISRAITEQDLEKQRQAELGAQAAHWKALQDEALKRTAVSQEGLDLRRDLQDLREREFEAKSSQTPKKFTDIPSTDDKGWLTKHVDDPAAWDRFDLKYGPGSAKTELPKAKDPRVSMTNLEMPNPLDLSMRPQSVFPNKPIPAATDVVPNNPMKRVVGQRYVLPNGTYTWTGTGWTQ